MSDDSTNPTSDTPEPVALPQTKDTPSVEPKETVFHLRGGKTRLNPLDRRVCKDLDLGL